VIAQRMSSDPAAAQLVRANRRRSVVWDGTVCALLRIELDRSSGSLTSTIT
jgi:hypothetical protein